VRELWQAKLGETGTYDGWLSTGAPSTADRAQARVEELLAAEPPAFPADLAREFDEIIAASET
jgi:trimethylamine:corrinoid methyltransferase-like protein